MAVLTNPAGKELFQQLKGKIDFYYWKGLLCARSFPQHCRQPGTKRQKVTWSAMKNKWEDLKYLTQEDKDAYQVLASDSNLSWLDVYTKQYLLAYNLLKEKPPVVFNVTWHKHENILTICWSNTKNATADILAGYAYDYQTELFWTWVPERFGEPPPNCSIKRKLYEYYKEKFEISLGDPQERNCKEIPLTGSAQVRYFTIVVRSGHDADPTYRTGVYRVT